MNKKDIVSVKCDYLSSEAKGVCKTDKGVYYVPLLLPLEEAKVQIDDIKGNDIYAHWTEILNKSIYRVNPKCGSFLKCGSCQLWHMSYDYQLKFKQNNVALAFKKESIKLHVADTLGMDKPTNYRNKVIASFTVSKREILYGLYEEGSHNIISHRDCLIQDDVLNKILVSLKEEMKKCKVFPFSEETPKGVIRHVLLRRGVKTGEVMVVFVVNNELFPGRNELVKALTRKHPEIKTIIQNTNPRQTSIVLGDKERVLFGKGYIEDILLGVRFKISAKSFYQINPTQTEKLYSLALDLADIKANETVFDAYCGIGTISLIAASKAKEVIGVEIVREAIDDAIINARGNNIKNARFICNDVKKYMQNFMGKIDCLILDPPRSGCDMEFLKALLKLKPKRLVYISCNPVTQARDIKELLKMYDVKNAYPVDMFPMTLHVECVCLLELKK